MMRAGHVVAGAEGLQLASSRLRERRLAWSWLSRTVWRVGAAAAASLDTLRPSVCSLGWWMYDRVVSAGTGVSGVLRNRPWLPGKCSLGPPVLVFQRFWPLIISFSSRVISAFCLPRGNFPWKIISDFLHVQRPACALWMKLCFQERAVFRTGTLFHHLVDKKLKIHRHTPSPT